jgi:hypothetical protein
MINAFFQVHEHLQIIARMVMICLGGTFEDYVTTRILIIVIWLVIERQEQSEI